MSRDYSELRIKALAARDGDAGLSHEFIGFIDEATPDTVLALLDEIDELRAAAPKPKAKKPIYPPEFVDAYECMERLGLKWRAGSTKPGAFACWKARITAGANAEEMHAGADKYARFCKATDRPIQMAQTFFGPQEFFTADWTVPKAPEQSARFGKFDPVAHINQQATRKDWDDGIIDINPR